MSKRPRLDTESGIYRMVGKRISPRSTRVRLLVAIPAVIVLLLCLMAGIFFWMTDAYLSGAYAQSASSIQQFSQDWLLFLALFVAGGAIIGYTLAWSLTRPIQDIIRLSERVAGGDLRTKVPVTRQDEMGQLGSSFNYMVESLNNFIETRNRFILESFTGGLVVTDLNGTVTAVNSAAEKLLDVRGQNVTGRSIREVFASNQLSDLLRYHERVVWKGENLVDKRLTLNIGNAPQQITANLTAMRDSAGNIFGVIINVRDLQEMERFYQHMRNSDRLATMGTFASGLAHEIKNPLGAIKGTAQLLIEDLGANHPSMPYLQIITKEVNRLDNLIREVQTYSQPSAERVPADMNRLLEEIITLAKADHRFAEKSYRLETQLQPLPTVAITKNHFRQAVLNIVLNALEAVCQNGTVRVGCEHRPGQPLPIIISVSNQGPPIPADAAAHIFEPFYTTKASGTGLGLSIAHQVAVNHGGRLSQKSEDGWVTFSLELPENNGQA